MTSSSAERNSRFANGEAILSKYNEQMHEAIDKSRWFWGPLEAYLWSVDVSRDRKFISGTVVRGNQAFGPSEWGNYQAGYGLAKHYGFLQSAARCAAAEIVGVLLGEGWARKSTAPQGKDYFGIGSVIYNAEGSSTFKAMGAGDWMREQRAAGVPILYSLFVGEPR